METIKGNVDNEMPVRHPEQPPGPMEYESTNKEPLKPCGVFSYCVLGVNNAH